MGAAWTMSVALGLAVIGQAGADDGADPAAPPARQLTRAPDTAAEASANAALTRGGWQAMWALGAVLVVITLAAWGVKRFLPHARLNGGAVFQVISRTHLSSKQSLALVRAGNRLIMLGITPDQITTLASFDDPDEMAALMTAANGGARGFGTLLGSAARRFDEIDAADGLEDSRQNVNRLIERIRGMTAVK